MHRRLQFDKRENPASDRRHGSRSAIAMKAPSSFIGKDRSSAATATTIVDESPSESPLQAHAASNRAATGGGRMVHVATRQAVAAENGSAAKTAHSFEPLISSCEAARLLGNIHVKTLQRYARHRRIPGYQIGGHWYFRASELDSWLRSRLNSSCHPCRLREESDGT
jgi:excisionase family DNA binding protein